jgi:hypothetical protein
VNHTLRSFATLSYGIAVFGVLFAGSPALHGQAPAQQARPGILSVPSGNSATLLEKCLVYNLTILIYLATRASSR